ncbi:MAG: hypothetical protein LC750_16045 [Actinobacteria bacterium]|nr:hypothetical protein [Actinomycetota bacterium]
MTDQDQAQAKPVRLRDAMPRPLLVAFLTAGALAVALIVILLVKPPRPSALALGERRSPPRSPFSHDVGKIVPAPVPSPHPATAGAPCRAFASLTIYGGAAAQQRLFAGLRPVCALTGPSITPELRDAVAGLHDAVLRFAAFRRSGEEATADLASGVVYINVRFARANTPTVLVTPILMHEGWHLAHKGEAVTATSEFRARKAELDACRQLIDRDKWIRNCEDAERIVDLGEPAAVRLLTNAGFSE